MTSSLSAPKNIVMVIKLLIFLQNRIKSKASSTNEHKEVQELYTKIACLEGEIKEMQQSLPSQAG